MLADIGGTHARFALAGTDGQPTNERIFKTAEHRGIVEAATAYLAGRPARRAVFVIAGPVDGDQIALTNCPWRFSIEATRAALGLEALLVVNDFVAQALAIPVLGSSDFAKLGGGEPIAGRPIAVIGPGTGLGVSALVPTGGGWLPIASEGGHVSFAPRDARDAAVLTWLRRRFGHVSNERLLSGPGLVNLAQALAGLDGIKLEETEPAAVIERARRGDCATAAEAVQRFCLLLGAAAGDLALLFGARGGVFVTGGMIGHLAELFDAEACWTGFIGKGRFSSYLEDIPLLRVLRRDTGLIGAAAARWPA